MAEILYNTPQSESKKYKNSANTLFLNFLSRHKSSLYTTTFPNNILVNQNLSEEFSKDL